MNLLSNACRGLTSIYQRNIHRQNWSVHDWTFTRVTRGLTVLYYLITRFISKNDD